MKEVTPEAKNAAIKTLAIIGFFAAVIVSIWLVVMIVRYVPSAFGELASIAETIYGRKPELTIATQKNIVNSSEPLVISWTNIRRSGVYLFSYECIDGVAAEARAKSGVVMPLSCEVGLPLSEDTYDLDVIFTSEKQRFIDVAFTIGFVPENATEALLEKEAVVTVVNASIVGGIAQGGTQGGSVAGVGTTTPTPSTPVTPTPTTPKPTTPTPSTPTTPVSNPLSYTDLKVTYLGVGRLQNGIFTPGVSFDNDSEHNAVRFEVKNIGTKTSASWIYTAKLPGEDTVTYSKTSSPLRPQEREVVTISFPEVREKTGTATLSVTVVGGDTNISNNSFSTNVTIVD